MTAEAADIIDRLAGIEPGSSLDAIRGRRPQARENAQASFRALFEPDDAGPVTLAERFAVAAFVAALHREPHAARFYAGLLAGQTTGALAGAVAAAAASGEGLGPYGSYPRGPLSVEDKPGPRYRVSGPQRDTLGPKLAAGLEHAHMLVFRPRDADAADLQHLLGAGWTATGIVTLSQLVAFLSFQIRVIAGLRALKASIERRAGS